MRALDGFSISNVAASSDPVLLMGGKYGVDCVAADYGTVKLQKLAADGTTYLSVATATDFGANGYAVVDLSPGKYRFTRASATAIYARCSRIPGE